MLKVNRRAFGALKVLLITVIVVMIVFTAFYVRQAQKQSNDNLDQAAKSTQTAKVKVKYRQPSFFTIREWGVRAPYSGGLKLEYNGIQTNEAGVEYTHFSSSQLDALGDQCKHGNSGGAVNRYKSSDHYLSGDAGIDTGKTAAQIATEMGAGHYGHVGDYYFFYTSPQAACSNSSQNLQQQTMDAVKALLPKLQATP